MGPLPLLVVGGIVTEVSDWAGRYGLPYGAYRMVLVAEQLANAPAHTQVMLIGSWHERRDFRALCAAINGHGGLEPILDLDGTWWPVVLPFSNAIATPAP